MQQGSTPRKFVEPKLKWMQSGSRRMTGRATGRGAPKLDPVSSSLLRVSSIHGFLLHPAGKVGTCFGYSQPVILPIGVRIQPERLSRLNLCPRAHPRASIGNRSLNTSDIQTLHGESKTSEHRHPVRNAERPSSLTQIFQWVTGRTFRCGTKKRGQISPSCRRSVQIA